MEKYDRNERESEQITAQNEDNASLLLLYDLLSPEERRLMEGMPLEYQDAWKKWMEEQHKQPMSLQRELLLRFFQTGMAHSRYGHRVALQRARQELSEIRACMTAYAACDYNRFYEGAYRYLIPLARLQREDIPFADNRWHEAVEQLETALVQNDIAYGLCTYQFHGLYDLQRRYAGRCRRTDVQSLLYSGIACATHKGETGEALSLYEQLSGMEDLPRLRRIGMRNRIAAAYEDRLEPEQAVALLMQNVAELEGNNLEYGRGKPLNEAGAGIKPHHSMAENDRTESVDQAGTERDSSYGVCEYPESMDGVEYEKMKGRTYSCLGTALIFAGRSPEDYYEKALDVFRTDEGNRHITLAHLLHYSVHLWQTDQEAARKLFWTYAPEFFQGCLDWSGLFQSVRQAVFPGEAVSQSARQEYATEMMASAIRQKRWNAYDLWVFLKCVSAFWMEAVTPELADWLSSLTGAVYLQDANRLVYWHILRLAGKILYVYQGSQLSRQASDCYEAALEGYRQRAEQYPGRLDLVTLTGYATMMEYNHFLGLETDNSRLYARLKRQAAECGWIRLSEGLEKGKSLDEILVFEHA